MTAQTTQPSTSGPVPVRVTLTCSWCGRSVVDVRGEQDRTNGRVSLAGASDQLRIGGGRARCAACGGPMFLEDWRPTHESPGLDQLDFSEETTEPSPPEPAAA